MLRFSTFLWSWLNYIFQRPLPSPNTPLVGLINKISSRSRTAAVISQQSWCRTCLHSWRRVGALGIKTLQKKNYVEMPHCLAHSWNIYDIMFQSVNPSIRQMSPISLSHRPIRRLLRLVWLMNTLAAHSFNQLAELVTSQCTGSHANAVFSALWVALLLHFIFIYISFHFIWPQRWLFFVTERGNKNLALLDAIEKFILCWITVSANSHFLAVCINS